MLYPLTGSQQPFIAHQCGVVEELDSNQRTLSGQIYSLVDLTTLPSLHGTRDLTPIDVAAPGLHMGALALPIHPGSGLIRKPEMPRNHSNRRKAHDSADNARRGPARPLGAAEKAVIPAVQTADRSGYGARMPLPPRWQTRRAPVMSCWRPRMRRSACRRARCNLSSSLRRILISRLPDGAVHQGVAVKVDPLEPVALEDLIDAGVSHIAVLDQVSDPHNLGAVYRSAAAFGFSGLVLQTRNAPNVTGVAAKAAVGAIETVREARVVNIARALEQLAEAGYHTVGLAGEGQRLIADAVEGAPKLAIVLGAEGPGIRPAVAKACAELARIPIAPEMESLNVSNAAAVAFYESSRNRFPLS